jgi:adenine-specific DNA-methyltransferase
MTCAVRRAEHSLAARKANGVYYTPAYIVHFIVQHTLGEMCLHKTPRDVATVRILDPTCGAGAFLLGAYRWLVDWYRNWYIQNEPQVHTTALCRDENGTWHLSSAQRQHILLKHIFGVDVDAHALALARQALIDECAGSAATNNGRRQIWQEQLAWNIKHGNALIGPDFPGARPRKGVRAFDWRTEFPDIMRAGGFDAVIGNPPYGASLTEEERAYLAATFKAGTTDTAALFMLTARRLTRPGGWNGFIVPKAFAYSSNWQQVRELLLDELAGLADAGKAWSEVKLEQVVYFAQKGTKTPSYRALARRGDAFRVLGNMPKRACRSFGFYLNGVTAPELTLARKIQSIGTFLGDVTTNVRGVSLQGAARENAGGLRVIGGKQIRPFSLEGQRGYLPSGVTLPPQALAKPGSILIQNIVAHIANPAPHIQIIGTIVRRRDAGNLALLDTVNQLANHSRLSSHYLLALLSSRLLNWYIYRFIFARAIRTLHFDGPVSRRVPIPDLKLSRRADRRFHNELAATAGSCSVVSRHGNAVTLAERREGIDAIVYKLYRLTPREIALVEDTDPPRGG